MLIEFDDANKAMSPYFDRVWGIIRGAWDDYQNEISERVRALNSPRTRASQIHDFMRDRATRLAELDSTIKAVIRNQMFVLVFSPPNFNGSIGLRLKKLDEDGNSRNQPTVQVKDFRGQLMLPEIEADYHLEAGYVADRFGLDLQSIDWVCPSGEGIYWKAEIAPVGANQEVFNLFPATDTNQENLPKEVVVRRKVNKQAGDENEGTGTS